MASKKHNKSVSTTNKSSKRKPKKPRVMGRPTKYSKALGDRICAAIAQGKSVRTICLDDKMPAMSTVFKWLREIKDFSEQYARACEERSEVLVEDILDIADDATNDWMDVWNSKKQEYERVLDREHVERSKVRIESRKWIASKLKPKKYGEKLDMTSGGERINPLGELTTAELRKLAKGK